MYPFFGFPWFLLTISAGIAATFRVKICSLGVFYFDKEQRADSSYNNFLYTLCELKRLAFRYYVNLLLLLVPTACYFSLPRS